MVYHAFYRYSSPSPRDIAYLIKRSARNYVISRKRRRGCPILFSLCHRLKPLYRVHLHENGDTETKCGLNYKNAFGTDSHWKAQNVKQR